MPLLKPRQFHTLYRALALTIPLSLASAPANANPTADTFIYKGVQQTRITEPVFNQQAMVYQQGEPTKPTVVLIHGLGQNGAKDWLPLIPTLAKHYHVLTFDLPGFGQSDKGNHLYSPDNYSQFIKHVSRQFANRPFALIGHSLGGAVSLRYAELFPDDLRQLILIDAAGILHRSVYASYLSNLGLEKILGLPPQQPGVRKVGSWIKKALGQAEQAPDTSQAILNSSWARLRLLGGDPNRIAGFALVAQNYSHTLRRVQTPTLVIWGEQDRVAPLRTGHLLANTLSNARLATLPDSSHVPMRDNTQKLLTLLSHNLSSKPDLISQQNKQWRTQQLQLRGSPQKQPNCTNKSGIRFSGSFKKLVLTNCKQITIENAEIQELIINNSTLSITNSSITDGVSITQSQATITSSDITGDIAINSNNSNLDIAGGKVTGRNMAIRAETPSTVFCSVCEISSPYHSGVQHQVFQLPKNSHM